MEVELEVKSCLYCGKILRSSRPGKRLNPKRKFCNHTCSTRYHSKNKHNKMKDNEEYKINQRKKFIEWYSNNKEKQKKTILNYYYNPINKEKWNERSFCYSQRERIKQFINPLCSCGQPIRMFFHKYYGDEPILKGSKEERLWIIKQYTQRNLIGVCSRLCLQKEKRKLQKEVSNSNEGINNSS